jgi:large exoprotein involved in heme utilization and adhesion
LAGNVAINNPDVNPTQGIEQAPENVVEPDETVAQACDPENKLTEQNTFTIVGRGGLPPSPTEMLRSSFIQVSGGGEEQRSPDAEEQRDSDALSLDENKKTFSSDEVIPARGMMVNAQGQIVLTAYPTPNAGERTAPKSNYCSSEVPSTSQLTFDANQQILKMKLDELLSRLKEQQIGFS